MTLTLSQNSLSELEFKFNLGNWVVFGAGRISDGFKLDSATVSHVAGMAAPAVTVTSCQPDGQSRSWPPPNDWLGLRQCPP